MSGTSAAQTQRRSTTLSPHSRDVMTRQRQEAVQRTAAPQRRTHGQEGDAGVPLAAPGVGGVATTDLQAMMAAGGNQGMLQLAGGEGAGGDAVHRAAAHGTQGAGGPLPHMEAIQRSFGGHDVGGVQAHVGGPAAQATEAMGAEAYAAGNHVAFGQAPSLHTAAHEAAHVVQQRGGVQLKGGVGQVGDAYERHADAVADRVVAGQPAGDLLDQFGKGAAGAEGVQKKVVQREATASKDAPGQGTKGATQGQQGGAAGSFDGLKALVGDIAGKVKTAQFVDAAFKAAIPIPQVPGLSVTVIASGTFIADSKGAKELSLKLGVGVQYKLGSLFNVNADFNEALKLKGNDLGAALVDAVKQSTYWALEKAGVHTKFAELVQLATEGPGFWDVAKVLVPVYGTYQAAKLAVAAFGADKIVAAHKEMVAFFQNDAKVGFEASLGLGGGGGVKAGTTGASGRLEARAGLEDVDNKSVKGFTELAGEVGGNSGNSMVKMRYSKRFREGGQRLRTLEIQSALSMPKAAFDPAGSQGLMRDASFLWSLVSVVRSLDKAQEGGGVADAMGVVSSVLKLGSQVFGNTANFDNLMGLDVKVTKTDDTWTVNYARIKMMTQIGTGTGVSVGGIEANVKIGSFFDVGGVLNAGLAAMGGK